MSFMIPANGIRLEAVLREPAQQARRGAALLCHPHPSYGGTMDNRVIYRAAKALREAGFATLRFNFRGVGASTGSFDGGMGEMDDVSAVIDWLHAKFPQSELALVGFSFGAWVGLRVGSVDPRIRCMIGLGLPLNFYDFDFLINNTKPSLFIAGDQDEFCPPGLLRQLSQRLPPASMVRSIEGADHFFSRQIDQLQSLIERFFRDLKCANFAEGMQLPS